MNFPSSSTQGACLSGYAGSSCHSDQTGVIVDFQLNLIRICGIKAEDILEMKEAIRINSGESDTDPFRIAAHDLPGYRNHRIAQGPVQGDYHFACGAEGEIPGCREKATTDTKILDLFCSKGSILNRQLCRHPKNNTAESSFFFGHDSLLFR